MMTEIDPTKVNSCPFCGGIVVEMHDDGETYCWRFVACLECSASVEIHLIPGLKPEERERETFKRALEKWNTRVETAK